MDGSGSKSKKRLGASSQKPLPDTPAFFLDRNLGKHQVAAALREAGAVIHVHEEHFAADARDEDWLAVVGRKGWIVLTKDRKIRYRAIERVALMNAGVGAFVLTAGNLNAGEMAQAFVKALPRIHKFLAKHRRPFIANVTSSGQVSLLFNSEKG
jgi:predicted nuclease of predicted toxin-antitoxin system